MCGFGWVSDSSDSRDHTYIASRAAFERLPKRKYPKNRCSPSYDQKGLNSSSANAVAASVEFDITRERGKRVIFPSRLFLRYNIRQIEGTVMSNLGVSIRDAIKSVAYQGDRPESHWPYVKCKFRIRPSRSARTGLSGTGPSSTRGPAGVWTTSANASLLSRHSSSDP